MAGKSQCKVCGQFFSNSHIDRHYADKHVKKYGAHVCPECNHCETDSERIHRHLRIEHDYDFIPKSTNTYYKCPPYFSLSKCTFCPYQRVFKSEVFQHEVDYHQQQGADVNVVSASSDLVSIEHSTPQDQIPSEVPNSNDSNPKAISASQTPRTIDIKPTPIEVPEGNDIHPHTTDNKPIPSKVPSDVRPKTTSRPPRATDDNLRPPLKVRPSVKFTKPEEPQVIFPSTDIRYRNTTTNQSGSNQSSPTNSQSIVRPKSKVDGDVNFTARGQLINYASKPKSLAGIVGFDTIPSAGDYWVTPLNGGQPFRMRFIPDK